MGLPVTERRHHNRDGARVWNVSHATLRPGCPVQVVDLSPAGAQIVTDRQLRPGARVHIRIVFDRWSVSIAAHVLRCSVSAIHPDRGVVYRGGLRFDERCDRLSDHQCPTPRGEPHAAACEAVAGSAADLP